MKEKKMDEELIKEKEEERDHPKEEMYWVQAKLLICITIYGEGADELERTLEGVDRSLASFIGLGYDPL